MGQKSELLVMLIDDDKDVIDSFGEVLSSRGIAFKSFISSEEALKAYYSEHFDIVITDLKMPVIDGFKILRAVKGYDPNAKVMVLTSCNDPDNFNKAMKYGAYGFYQKPLLAIEDFISELFRIKRERDESR